MADLVLSSDNDSPTYTELWAEGVESAKDGWRVLLDALSRDAAGLCGAVLSVEPLDDGGTRGLAVRCRIGRVVMVFLVRADRDELTRWFDPELNRD